MLEIRILRRPRCTALLHGRSRDQTAARLNLYRDLTIYYVISLPAASVACRFSVRPAPRIVIAEKEAKRDEFAAFVKFK